MSSSSSNNEKSNKKPLKDEKTDSSKTNQKSQVEAGTSKSYKTDTEKTQNQDENDTWSILPKNMWFWKPGEPQQEVQLKNWSLTSQPTMVELQSEQRVTITESRNNWPDIPQNLLNQQTLDQIIQQRKLRENQLSFAEDYSNHIDYLGDRMSKTKLNILIAHLNHILPSSSQASIENRQKLMRSKPLQLKKSSSQKFRRKIAKVPLEPMTSEQIAQQEQLRQNQIQEYENLRDQIDVFEARPLQTNVNALNISLNERSENILGETISKTDLNNLIDILDEMPSAAKGNINTLQAFIQSKPQIIDLLEQFRKKTIERLTPEEIAQQKQLRQNQMQEFENLRDQIGLYGERSEPANLKESNSENILAETISKTDLTKIVKQLDEPKPLQIQQPSRQFQNTASKIVERLTPEEIAKQEQVRQNQIQEYEVLREQIDLFGEPPSPMYFDAENIASENHLANIIEETISKTQLTKIVTQLNEPNPLQYQKATRPSRIKTLKIPKYVTPEELALQEQLRQNRLQEYEDLQDQIESFGESSIFQSQETREVDLENKISKSDLNSFISHLKRAPHNLGEVHKIYPSQSERRQSNQNLTPDEIKQGKIFRFNQKKEFQDLCNKLDVFGEGRSNLQSTISDMALGEN